MWTSVGTLVSLWFFIQLSAAAKVGGASYCCPGVQAWRQGLGGKGVLESCVRAGRPRKAVLGRLAWERCPGTKAVLGRLGWERCPGTKA
jgi:hypothetical protein